MNSNATCIAVLVMMGACANNLPPVVIIDATVGTVAQLATATDGTLRDDVHYRWELVEAPPGSVAASPRGEDSTAMFMPDVRGRYLVECWIGVGVSEDLTHEFLITAAGVPPVARISASRATTSVGMTVSLDAATSSSLERLPLHYRWKLASEPSGSQAQLSSLDGPLVDLTPDGIGSYVVELAAFDGELWSTNAPSFTINVF